jgi:superfamily II DNA or RNA helicase
LDVFNEEGVIISRELGDTPHRVLDGGTPDYLRQKLIREFQEGSLPIIISKPKLLGFGMNFQADCAMKFSDWTDSFEQQYQLSGGWYGQTKNVRIHIAIVRELEGSQWENLQRKQAAFEEQGRAAGEVLLGSNRRFTYQKRLWWFAKVHHLQ